MILFERESLMKPINLQHRITDLLFIATIVCLSFYFTYAAVQGQYGLFNNLEFTLRNTELEQELNRLTRKTIIIEEKVYRLSNQYLDLDLLDEQARKILGMARADEIILP